jgi:hypothetical protein
MKDDHQKGQALIFATLGIHVFTGVCGLAIDIGYLRYEKRRLQTAADSAAIAAASELNGDYTAAALNDSKANGFEDGKNGVTVSAFPPRDPPFAGKPNYIEVQVQRDAPTFFMRIVNIRQAVVSASAVARLGSSNGCVYSLGLLGGINVNATVNATACGVVDNALLTIGGGCLNAGSVGVVAPLLGGCVTPLPIVGIDPAADPLSYLVAPATGGCLFTNVNINSHTGRPVVLTPGTYCGGIKVSPNNADPINFTSGTYILTGGGLQIQGGSDVTGNGVTFFVTGGGAIQINGTGNITLTASTTSPVAGVPGGILFFQDRGDTQAANIAGANLLLTGTLYFPSAQLTLGGSGNAPYLILVSQSIDFNGNLTIGTDYSSLAGGSPIKSAVLVE